MFPDVENISLLFPVSNPSLPRRLEIGSIILEVSNARLSVLPKDTSAETFEKMQETASKLVELFPHNPISAVGINFGFSVNTTEHDLSDILTSKDSNLLSDQDFELQALNVKRKMKKGDDTINLSISYDYDDSVVFDWNFHYEVNTMEDAKVIFEKSITTLKEDTVKQLEAIYGISDEV